jgi:hypothetical protein
MRTATSSAFKKKKKKEASRTALPPVRTFFLSFSFLFKKGLLAAELVYF